jgi:hypothetical protein
VSDVVVVAVQNINEGRVPRPPNGESLMMKLVLPLALVFAAGTTLACPASDKSMDAKADQSPAITATAADQAKQTKADVDKKDVKPAEVKKPTS